MEYKIPEMTRALLPCFMVDDGVVVAFLAPLVRDPDEPDTKRARVSDLSTGDVAFVSAPAPISRPPGDVREDLEQAATRWLKTRLGAERDRPEPDLERMRQWASEFGVLP